MEVPSLLIGGSWSATSVPYKDVEVRKAYHKAYSQAHKPAKQLRKPTSRPCIRSRERLAWAAGLFEGEGCFSAQRSQTGFNPKAMLMMTDFDRVIEFYEVLGFGNFQTREGRLRLGHKCKEQLEWNACRFELFQATVAFLWNWLGPRRRGRAKELLIQYHANHADKSRADTK